MVYLIGTDEAGYGPNYGPLVISASVWRAPDGVRGHDLFGRLDRIIAGSLKQAEELPRPCMVVADSKILYNSGGDLRHLERGLWAAWSLLDRRPRTWREAWNTLAAGAADEFPISPWFNGYDAPVPTDVIASDWPAHGTRLRDALLSAGVELTALTSRAVFPREFNRLLSHYGSKGTLLSHVTLELVEKVMHPISDEPISVVCDKHGGRNCYAPLLMQHFPDHLIEIHGEGRQKSVYSFGPQQRRVDFCFQAKGEDCLPAALASMASKYLRELAMRPFNEFWCSRVPGLAPTAGYPQDAARFKAAIAPTQRELGIEDEMIWRVK